MSRWVLLALVALLTVARPAEAQFGGGCETFITITQSPASPSYSTSATITVEYGDLIPDPNNQCLSYGGPNPSSFRFYRNGVDVTSSFSVGGSQAVGTITLVDETTDELVATIDGNDVDGNPRQDSDVRYVFVDTTPAPDVNPTPYNPDVQDMGRCAISCFAATYAQGTVPYFTMDTPRNVTLVYHGDRVMPQPFVHVDVAHPAGASTVPTEFRFSVQLYVSGAWTNRTFLNGEQTLRFTAGTQTVRLGAQFDATALATGAYPMRILVTSYYAGGSVATTQVDTRLVVVNEAGSPVARGWTIAGVQRLYSNQDGNGSVVITEGDGSAVYFNKPCPTCSYTTPSGDFSTLVAGTPGGGSGWTRKFADSTMVVFNSAGQMTQVRDRFLNATNFGYDGNGRLTQIQDPTYSPAGVNRIVLSYGTYGLASIQDPTGRTTTVSVPGSDRLLTSITDPDGYSTTFGYDGSLRLQTVTDRLGQTATLGYDAQSGKLATITAPAVATLNEGTVSPVTTLSAWQRAGVPYGSTSSPVTPVTPATMEGVVTDAGGHQTHFAVNRYGQPLQTTDAVGVVRTATYNGAGQVTNLATPMVQAGYSYDYSGFLTASSVNGVTQNFRYTNWGQVDSTWGSTGAAQRLFIGANGKVDSVRVGGRPGIHDSLQTTYRYTYESRGRIETVRDPQKHLAARVWYNLTTDRNRTRDSLPGGRVTTYSTDGVGRVHYVDQAGLPTRTTEYDVMNRPRYTYDGVNANPTTLTYNALDLVSVTDPKGQVYSFDHNALGWVTRRYDPLNYYESFHYNRDGDVLRWSNRRGQSVDYAYDAVHRTTSKSGANTTTETFTYTPDGRVVTAASPISTVSTWLNAQGQPDSVKTYLTAGYTYYRRYRYTAGRLDSVWTTGSYQTSWTRRFAYNPTFGSLDSMRVQGLWTRFGFNPDRKATVVRFPGQDSVSAQMTSIHGVARVFSAQVNQRYHYDGVGRLDMAAGWQGKQRNFSFDSLGRLQQTVHRNFLSCSPFVEDDGYSCTAWLPDSSHMYGYDQVGNRTDLGGSYNTGNQITHFNGCSYGTDNDGNVASRSCGGTTVYFTWSAENRLTGYSISGGPTVSLDYDAGGRLSRRISGSIGTNYYLWEGANLAAELNSDGTKAAEYSYYGMDRLHELTVGSTTYNAHQDAQGNVLALTDANRNLARTYNYEDFGRAAGGTDYVGFNSHDRARWKGALWMGPELELYYMRNRWYEPQSGRFLSEDPIGLAGGINPYAFAGADPVDRSDPSGLCHHGFPHWPEEPLTKVCDSGPGTIELTPIEVTAPAYDPWLGNDPAGSGYWPYGQGPGSVSGSSGSATVATSRETARDPRPTPEAQACGFQIANTALTGLTDLAFFTGAGAAVRLFRAARFAGNAAEFYRFFGQLGSAARAMVDAGARARGSNLVAGTAADAYFGGRLGALGTTLATGESSAWDLIPGLATINALSGLAQACFGR